MTSVHVWGEAPATPREARLTVLQIHAARSIAEGVPIKDVAARYNVNQGTVQKWCQLKKFQAEISSYLQLLAERSVEIWADHERQMQDELKAAEREAVHVLRAGLSASSIRIRVDKKGKPRRVYEPDWGTRRFCAANLLDRRGERGKAVERVQQANYNVTENVEIRNQLISALADPGVREWLERDPTLAGKLRAEVQHLLEAPCEMPGSEPPAPS